MQSFTLYTCRCFFCVEFQNLAPCRGGNPTWEGAQGWSVELQMTGSSRYASGKIRKKRKQPLATLGLLVTHAYFQRCLMSKRTNNRIIETLLTRLNPSRRPHIHACTFVPPSTTKRKSHKTGPARGEEDYSEAALLEALDALGEFFAPAGTTTISAAGGVFSREPSQGHDKNTTDTNPLDR